MRKSTSGFTIVELLVVITVIGILTTISMISFTRYQATTRNSQRSSDMTILAEALEKFYSQNGEYPSCNAMTATPATVVSSTLIGIDPTVLTAPLATAGMNSIPTGCPDVSNGAGADVFAYIGDGTCSGNNACTHYTLKYRDEISTNVIALASRH